MSLQAGSTTQPLVTSVTYDAADRLTALTLGNGVTTTYQYDALTQRLAELRTAKGATVLQQFLYSFDRVGNVTGIDDQTPRQHDQTFQYDGLHRLTQAHGLYGTATYQVDPLGNLTSKEGVSQTYPAPGPTAVRPHAVTSTSDGWTFTYDATGNLTEKRQAASGLLQTLRYDAENRLVEATTRQRTLTLTLQPGWNSFTLPVEPDNAAISALVPTAATDLQQISRWEPTTKTEKRGQVLQSHILSRQG